jgi:hypothetical protein
VLKSDLVKILGAALAMQCSRAFFPGIAIMKVVVQFSQREQLKALPILLRHSPGMVLPNRTYVISEEAVRVLRGAGVKFTEVSRESDAPSLERVAPGERI